MLPVAMAALAVGTLIKSYGQLQANAAQAAAEERNAAFYREQADFAKASGDRKRGIFDRESQVIYGDQQSAFAKAGVDTGASSFYMSQQVVARQNESYAIKEEADFNVRLAMLRADQASSTARSLTDPSTSAMIVGGNILTAGAQIYGGS